MKALSATDQTFDHHPSMQALKNVFWQEGMYISFDYFSNAFLALVSCFAINQDGKSKTPVQDDKTDNKNSNSDNNNTAVDLRQVE